jgi:soluble lytic murein transglycosylase-like protein
MVKKTKGKEMNTVMSLIIHYSVAMNFDPAIALSVAKQESNFNNDMVGDVGEVGIFQVRPEFIVNFTEKELHNREINIKVGIELLKKAQKLCKHKANLDWLVCYNAGVSGGNRYKYPSKAKYVVNVNNYYKEFKYVYANSLPKKRSLASY